MACSWRVGAVDLSFVAPAICVWNLAELVSVCRYVVHEGYEGEG